MEIDEGNLLNGVQQFFLTWHSIYDAASKATLFLVAGVALKLISSSFARICFGLGTGLFISKLVINLTNVYNSSALRDYKLKLCEISDRYPQIRLIIVLFAWVIGKMFPKIGFSIAAIIGAVGGVIVQEEMSKKIQSINAKEHPADLDL